MLFTPLFEMQDIIFLIFAKFKIKWNKKYIYEIFNLCHLSMVTERIFGIWMRNFAILNSMSTFQFSVQVNVVVATLTIHNFLRKHNDGFFDFMPFDDALDLISDEWTSSIGCILSNVFGIINCSIFIILYVTHVYTILNKSNHHRQ